MRVLVTWGSKRGGTEGIARVIADTLAREGCDVELAAPSDALHARAFDAAIVGGALYAMRWHRDARRFVERREHDLRLVPTWFFSSGPLDDSASREAIPPTRQVASLMERVGAQGHATFGGYLAPDAKGFPASAMAKKSAGDHRDLARVRAWATDVARALPSARPRPIVRQPGRSLWTLVAHAVTGWLVCGLAMLALLVLAPLGVALTIDALVVPIVFAFVARSYFSLRGAREPLPAALGFAATFALLDVAFVAGLVQGNLRVLHSVLGVWLPAALALLVTWTVGLVASFTPSKPRPRRAA